MCHLMSFYVATALSSHENTHTHTHFICLLQQPIKCKTHAVGSGTVCSQDLTESGFKYIIRRIYVNGTQIGN